MGVHHHPKKEPAGGQVLFLFSLYRHYLSHGTIQLHGDSGPLYHTLKGNMRVQR